MLHISAREAKNGFGRLIDLARAEPVSIDKHGRPVVVVLSVEEYERLTARDNLTWESHGSRQIEQEENRIEAGI